MLGDPPLTRRAPQRTDHDQQNDILLSHIWVLVMNIDSTAVSLELWSELT